MKILGVDCWDVIFRTPTGIPLPGAMDALREIVRSERFDKIYIVSKVDPVSEQISIMNFWIRNFWKYTGIKRENIFFCRRYEDKAVIAGKLGITHFIDDNIRVFVPMDSVPNLYAFSPRKSDIKRYAGIMPRVRIVRSWAELLPLLAEKN